MSIAFDIYCAGIFLVYDISDKNTFLNVKKWLANIQTNADAKVVIILLGNKSDSPDRQVSAESGRELAAASRTDFFETSAKTGMGCRLLLPLSSKPYVPCFPLLTLPFFAVAVAVAPMP